MFEPQNLFQFLTQAEALKNELRHSYTSSGRAESVGEHTWMLTLIAVTLIPQLEQPVDLLKVLKMLVIHDLPEVITGDVPTFDKDGLDMHAEEAAAMRELLAPLPDALRADLFTIWEEYEAQQTREAQVAYAIDKLEAIFQHNLASLDTWDDQDYAYQTQFDHPKHQAIGGDPVLEQLKAALDEMTLAKIDAGGMRHRIRTDDQE